MNFNVKAADIKKKVELEATGLERSIHSGWCFSSALEAVAVPPCMPCRLCQCGFWNLLQIALGGIDD